ncbi:hypothetical protein A6U89_02385 [Agrobacterium sp. B133/95]|nr:hypothetical protein A6U89_02385 [Agrobacterium sp. B133/95]
MRKESKPNLIQYFGYYGLKDFINALVKEICLIRIFRLFRRVIESLSIYRTPSEVLHRLT